MAGWAANSVGRTTGGRGSRQFFKAANKKRTLEFRPPEQRESFEPGVLTMTTRVQSGGPVTGIAAGYTAPRVTPPTSRPFSQIMKAGAEAIVSGAEAAVSRLPGGPILAAAVRPGGGVGASGYAAPEGPMGTGGQAGAGGAEPNIEQVMSQNQQHNLYYLELQERVSAENRNFTTLSNVLKARHDTVKNAIGNVR